MANKEVCEVFIEQQIEEGLAEGKKPYSIGKELAAWVKELFEANIPAKTIEKRAQRSQEEIKTNVLSDATPESASAIEHIQEETGNQVETESWVADEVKGHGGKRNGAGRPKRSSVKAEPVAMAEKYVDLAIMQLERIATDDPERIKALTRLLFYVNALIKEVSQ